MPRRRIRVHYETLSVFERGRIIVLKEKGWINRRIIRHMGRRDTALKICCQEWLNNGRFQRHDGWNHADWGRIVLRDESRFHLCPDDHPRRVRRPLGQRADSAFPLARHTGPLPGVMVWVSLILTAGSL
ncbi:HTH_Tnp_Tc3_2 domain-containing protein [Trichonephila clavipes]|nr:HTH_Tnp_Tc3_2 domain-containing protein [Trichonephila clavipes]